MALYQQLNLIGMSRHQTAEAAANMSNIEFSSGLMLMMADAPPGKGQGVSRRGMCAAKECPSLS